MKNLSEILSIYNTTATSDVENINEYLANNLSEYRYDHSLKVVEVALRFFAQYKLDPEFFHKLILAALAHDITKEKPDQFHRDLFKKHNVEYYLDLPRTLYHSKSAPLFIQEVFHIQDPVIEHAILHHSTGCTDMPLFSRIIFCSDFMASMRYDQIEEKLKESISELCFEKIRETLTYLLQKKLPVQPESINFFNKLIYELE